MEIFLYIIFLRLPNHCKFKLSPSKKVIFFKENRLKMMKNAFSFKLKALFFLKIFKFLS